MTSDHKPSELSGGALHIRKWWSTGHEVTIRLTGDAADKRVVAAVHAFSRTLNTRPDTPPAAPTPDLLPPEVAGAEAVAWRPEGWVLASPDPVVELVAELRSSAKALRENTVYTNDGDPVRLGVQAKEMDQAADTIERQQAWEDGEVARLREALESLLQLIDEEGATFFVCSECGCPHDNIKDWIDLWVRLDPFRAALTSGGEHDR